MIKENQSKKKFDKQGTIKIKETKEDKKVSKEYDVIYDNVEKPKVSYNIKINLPEIKEDLDLVGLSLRILLVSNFSKMSDFNLELKNKNIIDDNIGFSIGKFIDYGLITIRSNTIKEEEFLDKVKNKFKSLELSKEKFELIKKTFIANTVYSFTTTHGIMGYLLDEYFDKRKIKEDYFSKLKEFTYEKYIEIINKIDFSNDNITIMRPLDEKE